MDNGSVQVQLHSVLKHTDLRSYVSPLYKLSSEIILYQLLRMDVSPIYLHNYKDLSGYTTCDNLAQQITLTAMTLQWPPLKVHSSLQTYISGALFLLTLGIQRDVGLAGRAAVSIISVTCPAQQPAAPPVIRLEFILGLKILDSIWLSADHWASLSVSSQTAGQIPRCQSVRAQAERVCL